MHLGSPGSQERCALMLVWEILVTAVINMVVVTMETTFFPIG